MLPHVQWSIPGNFCIALYLLVNLVGTPAYGACAMPVKAFRISWFGAGWLVIPRFGSLVEIFDITPAMRSPDDTMYGIQMAGPMCVPCLSSCPAGCGGCGS